MSIKDLYIKFINFKKEYEQNNKSSLAKLNSIRIYLTESCNANCSHCFNKDIRNDLHMDYDTAIRMLKYLNKNNIEVLKIMGGEPTIHPDFLKLYTISQKQFSAVKLFTNGLNEKIFSITPRKNDSIIYNFLFINEKFNFDKLLPQYGDLFPRVFEIVIDHKTITDKLISQIDTAYSEGKIKRGINNLYFQITLNCVCNIFQYKKEINEKFRIVVQNIANKYSKKLSFDHSIPYCFWEEETLLLMLKYNLDYYKKTCTGKDVGLIDSKFNLLHCNQYPIILTPMIKDNKFISFIEIVDKLKKSNEKKKEYNAIKACSKCEYFDNRCTGGCMMHKEYVKPNQLNFQ